MLFLKFFFIFYSLASNKNSLELTTTVLIKFSSDTAYLYTNQFIEVNMYLILTEKKWVFLLIFSFRKIKSKEREI